MLLIKICYASFRLVWDPKQGNATEFFLDKQQISVAGIPIPKCQNADCIAYLYSWLNKTYEQKVYFVGTWWYEQNSHKRYYIIGSLHEMTWAFFFLQQSPYQQSYRGNWLSKTAKGGPHRRALHKTSVNTWCQRERTSSLMPDVNRR